VESIIICTDRQISGRSNQESELGRVCGTHGRGEISIEGFGGKAGCKETTQKLRYRWEDGIRMNLREIGWGGGGGGGLV
jgi:hypothetical protein